jgi:ABC-type maltose transport system permease subunit
MVKTIISVKIPPVKEPQASRTLLAVLPVVILFLLLQKEFVAGLTSGTVKG